MSSISLVTLFLFVLSAVEFPCEVEGAWQCSTCRISYEIVGCYKDDGHRPLPTEILNERDTSNKNYDGQTIDWLNWDSYMAGFACRCAAKAKERGWSVFGLQYYGECWSGPDAESYKAVGESDNCVGSGYRTCFPLDRHCVGKQFTNMVYKIVPECDVKFEQLGCYDDPKSKPRPLPEYLLTDKDSSHAVFSGRTVNWRNWDAYLPELACRCAKKAKAKGYSTFGLQNYGECWSGAKALETYNKAGSSANCVDRCFKPCKEPSQFCAGQTNANFVYKLTAVGSVSSRRNHIPHPGPRYNDKKDMTSYKMHDKSHYDNKREMSDFIKDILEDITNDI